METMIAENSVLKKYSVQTYSKKLLADTFTPVSIYLKIRDKFVNSILLESSDYHGNENAFSYICFDPVAGFEVADGQIITSYPGGEKVQQPIVSRSEVTKALEGFARSFPNDASGYKFINNGLFGYISYNAVQYFEDIEINPKAATSVEIPLMRYQVFRFVIAINHFNNELYIFQHVFSNENQDHQTLLTPENESRIEEIESLIRNKNYSSYSFEPSAEEISNYTDEQFLDIIRKGKYHCQRGDVFQIVLSRRFQKGFKGDDFNVYRALRSVNPSPYLFYFDYGNFKIFGSSPEAQLVIKNGQSTIYPIAGTFRRTGNDVQDAELARKLYDDPKESAEHIMLVDLARNDLSKHCDGVKVETFKEVQYFSHVIHLVSKITGQLQQQESDVQIVADTFPAGTLSGAPKHRAMQLIDQYESTSRGYYGGCIGFWGFNGDFNHAIMIRSFLSKNNTLYYQAGAGVVSKSNEQSELEEVNNKLAALRKAVQLAEEIR